MPKPSKSQFAKVVRQPVSYTMPFVRAIRMQNGCLDGAADPAADGVAAQV